MIILLLILDAILLIIFFLIFTTEYINYLTHKSQTTSYNNKVKIGNYDDFLREFNKIKWKRDSKWSESFFTEDDKSKIHADIITFNEMGFMFNNLFNYIKFERFLKRNKLNKNKIIGKW